MRELESLVALSRTTAIGELMALATVVKVTGSSYRRPGARLLVTASGRTAGMISGGCLENDVRERALQVMECGVPRVVTYDSTAPEDIVFGLGLGCNGIIEVLIEPLTAGEESGLFAFLTACQERRQTGRMAMVFAAQGTAAPIAPGARLLHWPDGRVTAHSASPAVAALLSQTLNETAEPGTTVRSLELPGGGRVETLSETIAPPISLVIFGAGDDAIPVAQFAKLLGWHVTVADARPAYALPERFPTADVVLCLRPEALRDCPQRALCPDSLAMIMTHSFTQDKELLQWLLPLGLRYVGLLGPKARTRRLLCELEEEGTIFSETALARLHGPAGLDIGAETPEEIALSLLSEMQAVLANREGGRLRRRVGSIHAASEPVGAGT